jgi:hypothetical protein
MILTMGAHLRLATIAAALLLCGTTAKPDIRSSIDEEDAVRLASEAYDWPERYMGFDRREGSLFYSGALGQRAGGPGHLARRQSVDRRCLGRVALQQIIHPAIATIPSRNPQPL